MRKRVFLVLGICMMALVGCGLEENPISECFNTRVEKSIINSMDAEDDEDYAQYEEIVQENEIDEEGYFKSAEVNYSILQDSDAVHVTFARNSYITVQYFSKEDMAEELNPNGAYLHGNDCIYAVISEVNNPNTGAYEFSGFEVWEFDENNQKKRELEAASFENGLVYRIPEDFDGKEIAIVPLGEYIVRNILLNDYERDNNGAERALAGTWSVNGDTTTGNSASVNPVANYTVTYRYDPEMYVFVSSEPECLYNNETDGIVSFEEISAEQNVDSFSVELHKKSGDQEFDPDKYRVEHAEITYFYQGLEIESPIFIPDDGKIEYEVKNVEEGYWVPGNLKGEIEPGEISEMIGNLICKKEKVKVTLPQPDRGGTITYTLDGKVVAGDSVEALIGSEIQMTFTCKNGWSCEVEDGVAYKVLPKEVQRINIEGKDVNDIFTEQQYKPTITVTLDKSIGTYTEFAIKTVDGDAEDLKLDNEKKSKEVFCQEVGTKNDLILSAANGTLLQGEALRIEIRKEATDGTKETDIQYLQKIPGSLNISLYIADSSTVYETVDITVSKVKVVEVSLPSVANGNVLLRTTDLTNNRYLKKGDVIEDDRKVEIILSAKEGYYIKNSGKTENYSDILKYSKLQSTIETILMDYAVKKLCVITLDAEDAYGEVTYKIDGKSVESGTYYLKEEQKLKLLYEITDGVHMIARESSGWAGNLWNTVKNKTKESVDIDITPALDGGKVTRDMYIKTAEK